MTADRNKRLKVWAILHEYCGAREEMPEDFARLWPDCREYRFMGALGFGGKIWADDDGWRVSCYPEHLTDARGEMMVKANRALAALLAAAKDVTK